MKIYVSLLSPVACLFLLKLGFGNAIEHTTKGGNLRVEEHLVEDGSTTDGSSARPMVHDDDEAPQKASHKDLQETNHVVANINEEITLLSPDIPDVPRYHESSVKCEKGIRGFRLFAQYAEGTDQDEYFLRVLCDNRWWYTAGNHDITKDISSVDKVKEWGWLSKPVWCKNNLDFVQGFALRKYEDWARPIADNGSCSGLPINHYQIGVYCPTGDNGGMEWIWSELGPPRRPTYSHIAFWDINLKSAPSHTSLNNDVNHKALKFIRWNTFVKTNEGGCQEREYTAEVGYN